MSRLPLLVSSLALLVGLVACNTSPIDGGACPAVIGDAVEVTVIHATTEALEADGATGVLRDGEYVDTMEVSRYNGNGEPVALSGGLGRPGTYTIRIWKDGFEPWTRTRVAVKSGRCTVNKRRLTARLVPTDSSSE